MFLEIYGANFNTNITPFQLLLLYNTLFQKGNICTSFKNIFLFGLSLFFY